MLQVWLLGQFEIKLDGRRIVLSARAAQIFRLLEPVMHFE